MKTTKPPFSRDEVAGCLLGGALGDAFGGIGERGRLSLSDDTQFTLATCESIVLSDGVNPAHMAGRFLTWYRERRIVGIGSSTLKAMRDLDAGGHWWVAGSRGEMAAGNGGAMRIAPLTFVLDPIADRRLVQDVVGITHRNDEAFAGALAVLCGLGSSHGANWEELFEEVSERLPDSRVRDKMRALAKLDASSSILDMANASGTSGYVVETVPLALFAAHWMYRNSFRDGLDMLVEVGGDTDTIASIAGQAFGKWAGRDALPSEMVDLLPEREMVDEAIEDFVGWLEDA